MTAAVGRDADMARVTVTARKSGGLAIAARFAMAFDPRIASLDLDFAGCPWKVFQVAGSRGGLRMEPR
jgi:hypothetical protein